MNYTGLKCPVCGKVFKPGDDIVVCPECGAPYHRGCYDEAGKCVFSDKHGVSGFAWRPPAEETRQDENNAAGYAGMARCPRCGTVNQKNALFCQHCGLPLGETRKGDNANGQNNQQPFGQGQQPFGQGQQPFGQGQQPFGQGQQPFGQGQQPFGQGQQPFGQGQPFFFDPLGGVDPNETIDNIPVGEVAKFVQNGTQYYIPVFMNLKKFAKNRFNFSAFLLPGIWMLYRKMYKVGSVITGLVAALYICSAYITYNFIMPILQNVSSSTGGITDPFSMTSQQINMFALKVGSLPAWQRLMCDIPAIVLLAQIVIMLISGFNANRMYLKYSVSSIHTICQNVQNMQQTEVQLAQTGGVNSFVAICALIIYIIIYYVISSF